MSYILARSVSSTCGKRYLFKLKAVADCSYFLCAMVAVFSSCVFFFFIEQGAALVAVTNVYEWLDDISIRKMVLPKIKIVFEKNHNDFKIVANVLQCIERTLDKLDKSQVQLNAFTFCYTFRPPSPNPPTYLRLSTSTKEIELKMPLFAIYYLRIV